MAQSDTRIEDTPTLLKQYISENEKKFLSKSEAIAEAVIVAIKEKILVVGDLLPTVNKAVDEFRVARKTVVRSYDILKKRGIIDSKERLGYIIISDNFKNKMKVMMLIQSFNPYMELFYNSVVDSLGSNAQVDVYFHHYNPQVFNAILRENIGKYGKYIITSFDHKTVRKELKKIPVRDLIVCSRDDWMPREALSFTQDFYNGTFEALKQASNEIAKYESIFLIFPKGKGHSTQIVKSFNAFCDSISITHQVIESCKEVDLKAGQAYVVIEDADMVKVLEASEKKGFTPGEQGGLLSFNDTSIKKVIRKGVSVISTDFRRLGQLAAEAILGKTKQSEILPINYIGRNSL